MSGLRAAVHRRVKRWGSAILGKAGGLLLLLLFLPVLAGLGEAAELTPVERVPVDKNLIFSSIVDARVVGGGFVLLLQESRSLAKPFLVTLDRRGNVTARYDRRGFGPGELSEINKIAVSGGNVAAVEFYHPVLHLFDRKLRFIGDYRLKRGGDAAFFTSKFLGVKGVYHASDKEAAQGKGWMLALYDPAGFRFVKWAAFMPEVPAFVQYYGGVVEIPGGLAAVYPSRCQVVFFDEKLNPAGGLLKTTPSHIKPYTPWKKSRSVVDAREADRWLAGWTPMVNVFYGDRCYFITYETGDKRVMDIWDAAGNPVALQIPCRYDLAFSGDGSFWTVESEEKEGKEPQSFLVRWRVNQGRQPVPGNFH